MKAKRFFTIVSLTIFSLTVALGQAPKWVSGTPLILNTGPFSVTPNYGIDITGTVYIAGYNYVVPDLFTSAKVKDEALLGTSGTRVVTIALPVTSANIGLTLQTILDLLKANTQHTFFFVAQSSTGTFQSDPIKLSATTLPCPSATSGMGGNSCGLIFNFSATAPTYGTGTWTLTSGPGAPSFSPSSNTPGATVTVSDYGTYTFKWTVVYGTCTNSSTIMVNFYQQPLANAGNDRTLEYLFNTTMEAEPGAHETGVWSLILGSGNISDTTKANTSVSGLALGENNFLWTVTNGTCPPSKDYVTVTVNDLVIPTLITPNGDSKNEYFIVRGIETLGKTGLVIFDRRGVRVYENENYDNQWNGVDYNGNPLPDDTYFFIMKTVSGKSLNGYIVVRR